MSFNYKITNISRTNKQLILITSDSILLIVVLWTAYSIWFDYWYIPKDDTIRLILAAPIIGIPIFAKIGLYQSVIRHIDIKLLWPLLKAVSLYSIVLGFVGLYTQTDFIKEKGFYRGSSTFSYGD